ncbi:hypothetical protein [Alkaliphilus transvaalensis]|uniref:hypothetical protein n=1 Tax=Alkaliphilus transvaalensis TaxID=114628 RepID=UPI0012EBFBCC|nr:hypothetical protein [Alkaliphilus transvaalensis]
MLEVEEDGIIPFFINMARQQFYVNRTYGYDDLGRAILIFTSTSLNKSSKVFESKFGIGFSEWMLICFSVFASSTKGVPPRIRIEYYLDSDKKIAENESIRNVFKLLSIEPRYVSQACIEKISKINNSLAMQFDVYIESIFYDKPMLKLDESRYLVVHKHFLLRQATEGIYDLMKSITSGGTFGNEFGKAFEGYVSTLLSTFLSKDHIYTENDLIRYSNSKVCDFLLEFDDSIVLVECKGTEFNSIIATENAMRKDNSTRAFSKAFKQLNSIENLYKSGVFSDLVSGDKTVVKIILTYKQLYFANSSWYRKNILDYQRIDVEDNCYPEIMSIMEFEKFLYYMKETKLSPIQILNYRLENKYDGDWSSILNNVKVDLPLLRDSFNEFTDRMISNSR